jgi:hypothetical protein
MKRSASVHKLNEVRRYDISFRNVTDVPNNNISQTKLTTGNAEYDFLLRESLGIMSIGKSVLELPCTLASFDAIY